MHTDALHDDGGEWNWAKLLRLATGECFGSFKASRVIWWASDGLNMSVQASVNCTCPEDTSGDAH